MASTLVELPIPPVPSAQSFDTKGSLVSQPWQQWFVNLRDKVNAINDVVIAISGAGTTLGAFNTLSPLTTNGDLLTYNSGSNVRLPIGSSGQVLSVVSGLPTWVNPSAVSSPLTTKGDIFGYNTSPARIPVGTDNFVLTADSSNPLGVSWKAAGTPTLPVTTKGDLLGYSTSAIRVPVGSDGQVLTSRSSNSNGIDWESPSFNYAVPPFSLVASLLHFSGSVGSSIFTDSVSSNTWTAGSGATISNTQSIINTTSGYFNGTTNASISTPASSIFNLGSGNFTVEFSCYLVSGGPSVGSLLRINVNTSTAYSGFLINVTSSGSMQVYAGSSGTAWNILSGWSSGSLSVDGWSRVLFQRTGNNLSCYVNGLLSGSTSISGTLYYSSSNVTIWGSFSSSTSALMYLNECRIVNGEALVTSYIPLTVEFPNS